MLGHAAAPAAADAPTPAAGSAPAAAPTVAVLALQGAFIEHEKKLAKLGCRTIELRQRADLQQHFDALVLPGGESTVQAKLLRELGMFDDLQVRIAQGLPVLGTCAGLILLAEHVHSASDGRTLATSPSDTSADPNHSATPVNGFRTFPITVVRNGYGRQLGSFIAKANLAAHTPPLSSSAAADLLETPAKEIPLVFIRAPRITATSPEVQTLVALDGEPMAVRFKNQFGCTFHPELTDDDTIYRMFLNHLHIFCKCEPKN